MTRKQKRFTSIAVIGSVIALAVFLAATALRDEIVFFYDPTDIIEHGKAVPGQTFRVGGLVKEGSVSKQDAIVSFIVSDGAHNIKISFDGLLPDLFREGQGIIAEGTLNADQTFTADTVLAKHDENYVPKELEDILREKEVWKGEGE
ncbi:MAG: cytochrome c maturation protein CcmE [Pseudomonadota bacterium]